MLGAQSYWLFLAGIALFIMGMRHLEAALQSLAGRPFKLWLRKNASRPLRALASGTVVTMVMQSSSIVNLLVLAFVGAGIIGMEHGLALVMGANVGTTATSWLIALLGFEWKVEAIALPVMGICGILYYTFRRGSLFARWLHVLFGFGLLFSGLGFIKTGAEAIVAGFPITAFSGYHPVVFLLIGFVVSSMVQSSSATMAIVMSVLATGSIQLTDAMAVALGAEVGTTLKVVLAAIGGSVEKKRVALGNFLFNLILTIAFMFLLNPTAGLLTKTIGLQSMPIALVTFQTIVNLAGVMLFMPMLGPVGRWLNSRFANNNRNSLFLGQTPLADTGQALDALRKEVVSLIHHVLLFSRRLFGENGGDVHQGYFSKRFETLDLQNQYAYIKIQHGEIFDYYTRLQASQSLKQAEAVAAERFSSAARNAMYAAKSFKDAIQDVQEFADSGKDFKYEVYHAAQKQVSSFVAEMELMLFENQGGQVDALLQCYQKVQQQYGENIDLIYSSMRERQLTETDLSSTVNLNRELTTALKSLVIAARDLLLTEAERAAFDELPGFIR